MLAEGTTTSAGIASTPTLPVDLRAALEFVVARRGSYPAHVEARIIGRPELVDELKRLTPVTDAHCQLIALGAEGEFLWEVLQEMRPESVLTLVSGPLARLVRRLRSVVVQLGSDQPGRSWRSLGYERVGIQGFLGPGAIGWAASERATQALGRPDLADRSRIALRQSASSSPAGRGFSTIQVREYRRVR